MRPHSGSPILVAIETSQRAGGVAVRDRQGQAHVELLAPQRRHDDDLIPAIDRLFARLGLSPQDLDVVGVSIGPGGFTGLRVAVSTAKMLAETLGARIVAVPTALVVAEAHDGPGPVMVALASKDRSFWATRLKRAGESWTIVGEPGILEAPALQLEGLEALIADRYLPQDVRAECDSASVAILEPRFDPAAGLAVCWRWWQAGRTIDPLTLGPLYARPPAAVAPLSPPSGKPAPPP